jgi:hypothetical protein
MQQWQLQFYPPAKRNQGYVGPDFCRTFGLVVLRCQFISRQYSLASHFATHQIPIKQTNRTETTSRRNGRQLGAAPSGFRGCGFKFTFTQITTTTPLDPHFSLKQSPKKQKPRPDSTSARGVDTRHNHVRAQHRCAPACPAVNTAEHWFFCPVPRPQSIRWEVNLQEPYVSLYRVELCQDSCFDCV